MVGATHRTLVSANWTKIGAAGGREAMALIDATGNVEVAVAEGEQPRPGLAAGHKLFGQMSLPVKGAEIVWARGAGVYVCLTMLKRMGDAEIDDSKEAMQAARVADAKATDAQRALSAPYQPFANRAAAEAATIPADVSHINVAGLQYALDPTGTALTTADGKKWSPLGEPRPEHFANVQDWAQFTKGPGEYALPSQISAIPAGARLDFGRARAIRTGGGNLLNAGTSSGTVIENGVLDLNRTTLGDQSGHGISIAGHDLLIRNMEFRDFGSDGSGGGAGVVVIEPYGDTHARRLRLFDSAFFADDTASLSFGYVLSNVECGIISRLYVEGVQGGNGYAHELKNDANHNSMAQLVAKDSKVAVAFGQQTAGVNGSDYNVVTNVVGAACNQGIIVGEGIGNVFSGGVHNATSGPGGSVKRGAQVVGQSDNNYVTGWSFFGDLDLTLKIEGSGNIFDVAAYDDSTSMALLQAGSERNVVRFVHTGERASIIPYITDNSAAGISGPDANVFRNDAGGERIGSRTGHFHDKLGESGSSASSVYGWLYEGVATVLHAFLSRGDRNDIAGVTYLGRGGATQSRHRLVYGSTAADDRYEVGVGNEHQLFIVRTSRIEFNRMARMANYSVATVPPPNVGSTTGGVIYVTDGDAGQPCLAVSDGSNWRRVPLGAAIAPI